MTFELALTRRRRRRTFVVRKLISVVVSTGMRVAVMLMTVLSVDEVFGFRLLAMLAARLGIC